MTKLTLLALLICSSCSGIRRANHIKPYISFDATSTRLENQETDSLKITYTGCGGFLIKKNRTAILIDPYFSNVGPLPLVLFKKLKTDTAIVDDFFRKHFGHQKDIHGMIKTILVAHSHYDHLADVPSVYLRNCNRDSTEIIGSSTTKHILNSRAIGKEVTAIKRENLNWIYTKNKRIKILPIPTEHAPHIMGMKLISSKKLTKDASKYPSKAKKFPEGENYNFLIDFLDANGEIEFRIFSHAGASCNGDIGIPDNRILNEKEVDVLLLCVASFSQVKDYPEKVIARIQAKFIIGNHWENFFRAYHKNTQQPATVIATNAKKFVSRVKQQLDDLGLKDSTEFKLPLPGVTFNFVY